MLVDYLGAFAVKVSSRGDAWWDVDLAGTKSALLGRQAGTTDAYRLVAREERNVPRWFEVFVGQDHIAVITRFSDEATSDLATGFAKRVRGFFNAQYEDAVETIEPTPELVGPVWVEAHSGSPINVAKFRRLYLNGVVGDVIVDTSPRDGGDEWFWLCKGLAQVDVSTCQRVRLHFPASIGLLGYRLE